MEETEQQNQKLKKNKTTFWDTYKESVVNKESTKLSSYKEGSGSWIFFNRIFMTIVDIIVWIVIGAFIWVWWTTRGQTSILTCADITIEMCNQCFSRVGVGG